MRVSKSFIYGLGRCDIVHILALRKLQYLMHIQRGQSAVLYNVFKCFKLSNEYMKLLTTYRCGSRDSASFISGCIERHFAALAISHP